MRVILTIVSIFAVGGATAQCNPSIHMFDIPYAKNSSYFSSSYSTQLNAIGKERKEQSGYLLLEFQVQKEQVSDELRTYNLWLAQRRIDRVKTYLSDSNFVAPVVTRILTAGLTKRRDMSVSWCPLSASPEATSVRLAESQETSLEGKTKL